MIDKTIIQTIIDNASTDKTVEDLWKLTNQEVSLSHTYYIVRKHKLPFKKKPYDKSYKDLEEVKKLDTQNMTINQIMAKLNLSTRNDYYRITKTLINNKLPYKQGKKSTQWDFQLLQLDTKNLTVKEIAKHLGLTKVWQLKKLYPIMKNLGLQYKHPTK